MQITWYGTASLHISYGGAQILFDPFVSFNEALRCRTAEDFAGMGDMFITHGHLDHLYSVPEIMFLGEARVFCNRTAAVTLVKKGVDPYRVSVVKPGDMVQVGKLCISVQSGQHIKYDWKTRARVLFSPRSLANYPALQELARLNQQFKPGEVLSYHVSDGEGSVLVLGSMNLDDNEVYAQDVDLLALPFQGRADLNDYALRLLNMLNPRGIFLDHFDDTFPPVSSSISTRVFVDRIRQRYPKMRVVVPEYGAPVFVRE